MAHPSTRNSKKPKSIGAAETDAVSIAEYYDYRWILAIEAADIAGDLSPLAKLLQSEKPLPSKVVRKMLATLFKDRKLNVPRKPWPDLDETKLLSAAYVYQKRWGQLRGEGSKRFMERIAKKHEVSEIALANFIDGRGGTYRRLSRRRMHPTV
jgi:hypothetical protein